MKKLIWESRVIVDGGIVGIESDLVDENSEFCEISERVPFSIRHEYQPTDETRKELLEMFDAMYPITWPDIIGDED